MPGLKVGSEEHKLLFCREFTRTFHPYEVRDVQWPHLDEANLEKQEIRELSRRLGLPSWDEPASACLSSRIPYHSEVTDEKLRTIERAEQSLRALGFRICRVRHHDDLARVEFGRVEMARLFLEYGADPVEADAEPWATPREWAKRKGHAAILRLLDEHKR